MLGETAGKAGPGALWSPILLSFGAPGEADWVEKSSCYFLVRCRLSFVGDPGKAPKGDLEKEEWNETQGLWSGGERNAQVAFYL